MAFLRLSSILKYLNATPDSRCVSEGEMILSAKLMVLCGVTEIVNTKYTIAGLCLQTSALSSAPHQISGELWQNGSQVEIKSFTCTCKAGLSETCKHISACLLYCSRYNLEDLEILSSTDLSCYWNKQKDQINDTFQPKPISSFECLKRIKHCRSLRGDEEVACLTTLKNSQPSSVLYKHSLGICGGPSKTRKQNDIDIAHQTEHQIEEVIIDDSVRKILRHAEESSFLEKINVELPSKPCCQNLLQQLSRNENFEKAAAVTQGSKEWFEFRKLRITGSTCYSIFTYSRDNWEKKCNNFFFPKKFTSKATDHGKKFEIEALTAYTNTTSEKVVQIGFLICKKFPWLGYSPDGIIINVTGLPTKLLEIKCPIIGVEEEADQLPLHCKYLLTKNGVLQLKKKHQYYGQIQLGMALLNLKLCDLIIYSPKSKSFVTVSVPFDADFAIALLQTISCNYLNKMIHFLCIQ